MTSSISEFTSPNKLRLYFLAFTAFSIMLFPIPWHIGTVSHPVRAWAGNSSAIQSYGFLTVAVTSMNCVVKDKQYLQQYLSSGDAYLVFDRYLEFSTKYSARKPRGGPGGCKEFQLSVFLLRYKFSLYLKTRDS